MPRRVLPPLPLLGALVLLTLLRLTLAALLPLSPDEAYYWVWSRALAPAYLDHPPMVALFIRAGTAFAGETALGVRLLAPLAAFVGSLALHRAALILFEDERAATRAVLLLNATLLFGAGAMTMTPDTPLLLFWTLGLSALAPLTRPPSPRLGRFWLLAGLAGGLALLSKYTALFFGLGIGLFLLSEREQRVWLKDWRVWAGALLALALFSPVLIWNAAHGWASFGKQGGRLFAWQSGGRYLAELIAGQIGLATPLPALLLGAGLWRALRAPFRDPPTTLLVALTFPGLVIFVVHALGDRVQANWPALLYPATSLLAARAVPDRPRLWQSAIASGFALTALVALQALAHPLPLPRRLDPVLARLGGWQEWAQSVEEARLSAGAAYVVSRNYGEASLLAWYLPRTPVIGWESRFAYLDLSRPPSSLVTQPGLLVESARRAFPPAMVSKPPLTRLGVIRRQEGGVEAETYRVYRLLTPQLSEVPDAALLPARGGASLP
jgi:4-amino-4-deoxy-L-arabinose transferase-like glycosyltransferase